MKKAVFLLLAVVMAIPVIGQHRDGDLRFDAKGSFRIAQFTDTHLDIETPYGEAQAERTLKRIKSVIETEKPDLAIFTGDVVTGDHAEKAWHLVLSTMSGLSVPFCVVLGNHDAEQDLSRERIAEIVTGYAGNLNTRVSGELDDVVLEVKGADGGTAAVLYCLDSHDYSTIPEIDGYGWFTDAQIAWYRSRSAEYSASNGGAPLPSLAFFHIALPEYVAAWRNPENTHIGRAAEDECPGALNPGMFAAMVECGDVMGTFVGHDHDIDYLVAEKGIALGYGRFSGDDTTYNNLRQGVRIIVLHEGRRSFDTWIREDDGRTVDKARFAEGKISKLK